MANQRQLFDRQLHDIHKALVDLGASVVQAIDHAVQSLKHSDLKLAQQVIQQDPHINQLEETIDDMGTSLIATQQPVAKDLRRILIAFKMANDLERMGDLAVNIAKLTIQIGDEPLIKPLVDLPRMAEIVQWMTSESIEAYTSENMDKAYQMAKMDDEVDELHSQILRELFEYMATNPNQMNQALLLCFASRHLERMADHATNIGENVVYLIKGKRPDLN